MSEFEVTGQPEVHACADRATVLRWVADALDGVHDKAPMRAIPGLLRHAADDADTPAPMPEPTTFGAMVDTDDGPAVLAGISRAYPWVLDHPVRRGLAWSELRSPRPYKASS